jgi:hypothetical protein
LRWGLLTVEAEIAPGYVKMDGNHAGEVMTREVAIVEEDISLS